MEVGRCVSHVDRLVFRFRLGLSQEVQWQQHLPRTLCDARASSLVTRVVEAPRRFHLGMFTDGAIGGRERFHLGQFTDGAIKEGGGDVSIWVGSQMVRLRGGGVFIWAGSQMMRWSHGF